MVYRQFTAGLILILSAWLGAVRHSLSADHPEVVPAQEYRGMCDASAAVAVSSNLFLVANDEDNVLRLYSTQQGGAPLQYFSLDSFLKVQGKSREADLEGAALVGTRAFWIGSHGRNKEGKERDNRHRFFATDLEFKNGQLAVTPVGRPCMSLVETLARDTRYAAFGLEAASKLTPKQPGALDIEALAATPANQILIGFRNPIPEGKALIATLENPDQVIQGQPCRFGDPILLDLGGLGLRDMILYESEYLLIAGAHDGARKSRIFKWAGRGHTPVQITSPKAFSHFNPEAVVLYPEIGPEELLLLSDDGTRTLNGVENKKQKNPMNRTFRSFWVKPDQARG